MNTKLKVSLVLIGTLIIGMLLGAVLHGAYMRQHFRKSVARMRSVEGFVNRFDKIIQPTPVQKETVDRILRNTFEKIKKRYKPPDRRFRGIMDSLLIELKPVLTPPQKKRLQEHFERYKKSPPEGRHGWRREPKPDK